MIAVCDEMIDNGKGPHGTQCRDGEGHDVGRAAAQREALDTVLREAVHRVPSDVGQIPDGDGQAPVPAKDDARGS
jgi:hypothetical protein